MSNNENMFPTQVEEFRKEEIVLTGQEFTHISDIELQDVLNNAKERLIETTKNRIAYEIKKMANDGFNEFVVDHDFPYQNLNSLADHSTTNQAAYLNTVDIAHITKDFKGLDINIKRIEGKAKDSCRFLVRF